MKGKIILILFLFVALNLVFVSAQIAIFDQAKFSSSDYSIDEVNEYIVDSDQNQVEPQKPIEDMAITLVSPKDNKVYELSSTDDVDAAEISFEFLVEPMDADAICVLNIEGTQDYILQTQVSDLGKGTASEQLKVGDYQWNINCVKQGVSFQSEQTYSFEVKVKDSGSPNDNANTNTNSNGGSSSKNDEESNGRRLQPISLPLEDLSTDPTIDEEESSGFSAITGAVIGALKNKGVAGIIILAVIVGVAGMVIYNRRKLGVVKASK